VTQARPRTCVIGAGVSGLTTAKALHDAGVPFTCFEASDEVGGNWYFANPNGWSSAYRSLHIDISKASISFADYPMADDLPDYPHHTDVFAYLRAYADDFDLRSHIRLNSEVTSATREENGGWTITLSSGEAERFDALVVANGHHWDPLYPSFPGRFDGATMHSHDYVSPADPIDFADQRVLIVGIGNSAVDIACELGHRGVARTVLLSTRSGAWIVPKYMLGRPTDQLAKTLVRVPLTLQRRVAERMLILLAGRPERFGMPKPNHRFLEAHPTVSSELPVRLGSGDVRCKPNVAELRGSAVRFADGSTEDVDVVIYATGYRVSFPFFDPDLISAPGNVLTLYKRLFKPGIDDLAFVGLAQAYPTVFPFAEAQSKLVAEWLTGNWRLPAAAQMRDEMARDEQRFLARFKPRPRHTMQHDTRLYQHDLERRVLPQGRKRAQSQ